ncbi:elongation of very long chain fatty acids protein AAEL008004-like [Melitaea cinxia]|uniref:elongation of very long chain fatty acids protein AAEL008004-like n=1 Tax=Melitaea cinxia TaxID=113334 RepID=UPI001E270EAD|nr:elongation of very long chain fatty acids protein AAEL008004-like [Melitaea cinxia]
MASLTHTVNDVYTYLTEDLASPVTKNWFLVGKLQNLLLILAGYLYFCTTLGPRYMKDRKPYNLKFIINIFNIFQILINLYLFYEGTLYIFFTDFNFYCQGVDDPNSPRAKETASLVWLYLMVKVVDLLDTVFFVLRKSNRQITQLHLHHHTLMPLVTWLVATYAPGGHAAIVGHFNSFVHAVMYTYYLLAGLGDRYKKYLWWKKYLTMLQLIQFVIVGAHSVRSLFYPCSYPIFFKILTSIYAVIFINMFGQFYYNSYIKATNTKSNKPPKENTKKNVNG